MRKTKSLLAKYERILHERVKHYDQPFKEFCKQHDIKPATFYYWKKQLTKSGVFPSPKDTFIPVRMIEQTDLEQNPRCISYEIRFPNGSSVHISGEMGVNDLTGVIRTVSGLGT